MPRTKQNQSKIKASQSTGTRLDTAHLNKVTPKGHD